MYQTKTSNTSIIGGGIGGLTTALCFEKLGIDYKIYEQGNTLEKVGAGIWLSPNALQVFEWINPKLLKEIIKSGNTLDRILVANHNLKPISNSNQAFVREKFGYTTIAIHRGELQKILYSNATKENIVLGKRFNNFSKNKDNSYSVEFLDNSSVTTNSIIGADGIHSNVRKKLFPKSKLRYSGQTCWRDISDYEISSELASTGFTLWG